MKIKCDTVRYLAIQTRNALFNLDYVGFNNYASQLVQELTSLLQEVGVAYFLVREVKPILQDILDTSSELIMNHDVFPGLLRWNGMIDRLERQL